MRLEHTIIKNLMHNDEYARKVVPFIKTEYFSKNDEKLIIKQILSFINQYNNLPTHESLIIQINSTDKLTESEVRESIETLKSINEHKNETSDLKWLLDQSERFCQEKAVYNAIMESISILEDKTHVRSKGSIPNILSDALGVTFDSHVGHDFMEDFNTRFDFYHKKEKRIPFDVDFFNKITKGGVPTKTLNIALAGCVHPGTMVQIRYRKHNAK